MRRYGSACSKFCAQAWVRLSRCLGQSGFGTVHTNDCPLACSVGMVGPEFSGLPPGSSGRGLVRFAGFTSPVRAVSVAVAMPNPALNLAPCGRWTALKRRRLALR